MEVVGDFDEEEVRELEGWIVAIRMEGLRIPK
jgi:hypothetical protein